MVFYGKKFIFRGPMRTVLFIKFSREYLSTSFSMKETSNSSMSSILKIDLYSIFSKNKAYEKEILILNFSDLPLLTCISLCVPI